MNEMAKKVFGLTSTLIKNKPSNEPFEIIVKKSTDLTNLQPHVLKVEIKYHDKLFKKRMTNLLNSKKHLLQFEFYEVNQGTLFKPIKELRVKTTITEAILDTASAFFVEVLTFVPTHLTKENIVPLKRISGHTFRFSSTEKRSLVADSLYKTLHDFLLQEYEQYHRIKSETIL